MKTLKLRKNEERRLLAGHLWIFSNEVDTRATPLVAFEPGESARLESSRGDFLGYVYVNPASLICARLCSRDSGRPFDAALIRQRLQSALTLRQMFYEEPFYRLVHGEGDFLPGLIIDRYDDVLVLQINTAGMERQRDVILDVLRDSLSPSSILLRNDSSVRKLENLPLHNEFVYGEERDQITLRENGLNFHAPLMSGQKTGWFYDHRENRAFLQRLTAGKRVLDVFSYLGGWAINAAAGGAQEVVAIDASAPALKLAESNAALNGYADRFSSQCGDALEQMRVLQESARRFDIVVLDPPAFIKRKKDHTAGLRQYELINRLAMGLLEDDGILVCASCSQHLTRQDLNSAMLRAARKNRRHLQILARGGQGPDHPVNAAMPETDYLKTIFARLQSA
ncbi:MAG: class I SAM-dependent rRNA methyltransferase [Gammaproteobacteria bacterium]|nr:class I SAM-dependent rRNA methyltransferase [Gammaproteobacteria bacterium]